MLKMNCRALAAGTAALALLAVAPALAQGKPLKFVQNGNLKILDPIWTTAYITRDHGYMIYDTLFATDANGQSSRRWSTSTTCRPTSSRGRSRCATGCSGTTARP